MRATKRSMSRSAPRPCSLDDEPRHGDAAGVLFAAPSRTSASRPRTIRLRELAAAPNGAPQCEAILEGLDRSRCSLF